MDLKSKEQLRQILVAVLVGTAVTFLTSLLQGLLGWAQGLQDNLIGGSAGAVTYLSGKITRLG